MNLDRLLDMAAFKRATAMDDATFTNTAMAGLIPRACGAYAGVTLWREHDVQMFCEMSRRDFNSDWEVFDAAPPTLVVPPAEPAEPAPTRPLNWRDAYPEVMSRAQAIEYLECSSSVLDRAVRSKLIDAQHDGRFVELRRADLDALMTLPIYTRRMRRRTKEEMARDADKPEPASRIHPDDKRLDEKSAADHLGIHYGALALSRKYGTGPVVTRSAGGAFQYRIGDLEAFRNRYLKKLDDPRERTKAVQHNFHDDRPPLTHLEDGVIVRNDDVPAPVEVAPVAPAPAAETPKPSMDQWLNSEQAAAYLGISKKSLQNFITHNKGPYARRVDEVPRRMYFLRPDLDVWAESNRQRIANANAYAAAKASGDAGAMAALRMENISLMQSLRPAAKPKPNAARAKKEKPAKAVKAKPAKKTAKVVKLPAKRGRKIENMMTGQAAEYLKVPESALRRWRETGVGPAHERVRSTDGVYGFQYKRAELDSWMTRGADLITMARNGSAIRKGEFSKGKRVVKKPMTLGGNRARA